MRVPFTIILRLGHGVVTRKLLCHQDTNLLKVPYLFIYRCEADYNSSDDEMESNTARVEARIATFEKVIKMYTDNPELFTRKPEPGDLQITTTYRGHPQFIRVE